MASIEDSPSAALGAELGRALQELRAAPPFPGDARRAPPYRRARALVEELPGQWRIQGRFGLGMCVFASPFGATPTGKECAIESFEAALWEWPPELEPAARAVALAVLARAYRWRQLGDPAANLESAIAACLEALRYATRRSDVETWGDVLGLLGECYLFRIRGDRARDVDRGICCLRSTLGLLGGEEMALRRGDTLDSLSIAYTQRVRGDRGDNLELAIRYSREAVAVLPQGTEPWANAVSNLGSAYANRIAGGRMENLELAVAAFEQALEVWRRLGMPRELAKCAVNLATTFRRRLHGDHTANQKRALDVYGEALAVLDRETSPFEWALVRMNQADAYMDLFEEGPEENLSRAIQAFEEVRQVLTREVAPLDWAKATHNLALAYHRLALANEGRPDYVERAARLERETQEVFSRKETPVEWANSMQALANIFSTWRAGHGFFDLRAARQAHLQALEVFRPALLPDRCRSSAYYLGLLEMSEGRWEEAAQAFRLGVEAAETLYRGSVFRDSRDAETAELDDLHREAAYCLARAGHVEEAVVCLETGRARRLGEALADRSRLERLAAERPELYDRYRRAVEDLRSAELTDLEGGEALLAEIDLESVYHRSAAARAALDGILEEIRRLPDYETLRRRPDGATVVGAVSPGAPLVYLVTARAGSMALLFHREGERREDLRVEVLWIELDAEDLAGLLGQMQGSDGLAVVLPELGRRLVAPVAARLRALAAERAVLVPCGLLGVLPLHAASYEVAGRETCLLDELDVSFAPSATVLAESRSAALARAGSPPALAGVGDPESEGSPLPYARAELEEIRGLFGERVLGTLEGGDATRDRLLELAPGATHLHLACHGQFAPEEPLDSALLLAQGERLTLREVIGLNALASCRLVVLSACQSALSDFLRLTDEAVGLPAGFLQAGAAAVVGSLWPVNDLSTALTMTRFYELHLRERATPAQALAQAQRWLRDLTSTGLASYLQSHPGLREAEEDFVRGNRDLPSAPESPPSQAAGDRPFADPYSWAPFILVGV